MAKGMEIKYRSSCGRYEVSLEASDQQSLFEQLASFQEIFEDDVNVTIEGEKVPSTDIIYRVRSAKDKDGKVNEFYEKVYCGNNPKFFGYKMEYGCSQENKGSLFPKRKDKDGTYYKNNGWHKWEGQGQGEQAPTTNTKNSKPF